MTSLHYPDAILKDSLQRDLQFQASLNFRLLWKQDGTWTPLHCPWSKLFIQNILKPNLTIHMNFKQDLI